MNNVIKILGTGCPNCKKTIAVVKETVKENNLDYAVIKVEEIEDIMKYNIMSTPAVVIDEQVMIKGRVPSRAEILELLT
jgi:small redox-active disulfide protein 2